MKPGVEEYDPENRYGSENINVWPVFQRRNAPLSVPWRTRRARHTISGDSVNTVKIIPSCVSACKIGSDSYVERPGLQDLSLVEQGMTVRSYVRPLNAAPGRWPR